MEEAMERERRDEGRDDEQRRERAKENRREVDEVSEPGTDPLHEGP